MSTPIEIGDGAPSDADNDKKFMMVSVHDILWSSNATSVTRSVTTKGAKRWLGLTLERSTCPALFQGPAGCVPRNTENRRGEWVGGQMRDTHHAYTLSDPVCQSLACDL